MTYLISSSPPKSVVPDRFGSVTLSVVQGKVSNTFEQITNSLNSSDLVRKSKKTNSALKKLVSKIKEYESNSKQLVNVYIQKRQIKDTFMFSNKIQTNFAKGSKNKANEAVKDPKNQKKIRKLKKYINEHQESIAEIENKQYDDNKNKRIQTIQTNLRNGVNVNNRVRDYLQRKKDENSDAQEQIRNIKRIRKKNTVNSFVLKKKKEKISELQTAIKRKEFNLKKLIKIFETKSNVSNKERLETFKLQLESKKQESKRLQSELNELQEIAGKKYGSKMSEEGISSMSESDNLFVERVPSKKFMYSKSQLYSEDERWKEQELTELSNSSNEVTEHSKNSNSLLEKQKSDLDENDSGLESKVENNQEGENENKVKKGEKIEDIDIKDTPTLLTFPAGVEYFKEYLVQQMSQENLLFYLDVKKFTNTYHTNKNVYQTANKIYKTYIKNGSIFEVNIDYKSRETLEKLITEKKISFDMFNHAQDIVFGHMDHNEFGPFKKSKIYQNLIQQLKTQSNFDYDIKTKKSIFVTKTNETKVLNTDFHFKGKARKGVNLAEELMESIIFIFNSYYSISTKTIELNLITQSLAFNRFVSATTELQKLNVSSLTYYEKLGCFINIYNTLLFHISILYGLPSQTEEKKFHEDYKYNIGGYFFSLNDILNGILRNNKDQTNFSYFKKDDPRREFCLKKKKFNPKIHFCLNNFNSSTIIIQTIYQKKIKKVISHINKVNLSKHIFLQKKKLFLPRIFRDYAIDFGSSKSNILQWIYKNLNMKNAKKKIHFNESTPIKFYKNTSNLTQFLLNKNSQMLKKFGDNN
ncbi:electron carrier/ protein disulfide oxidoreductase [Anaeramoeba flamelloides]|uniref:Electron carrier/ protein disulfide oxidoreductase n=1 Tax=Anaeramoeba flamelloides TaxID=1746091 RepID=A0AAV7ZJF5_9EUKA|nr:electron carrier/ protein disulfide oxidoreductase [Anaeramoeba flamelloides]